MAGRTGAGGGPVSAEDRGRATELADGPGADAFPEITNPLQRAFLVGLAATGIKKRAADIAGIHPTTPYTSQWKNDEVFQAALARAEEMAKDIIEAEIHRRAIEGVEKPVGWYRGKAGGYVREYSDNLLMFLAKGADPEKYRDRLEIRGSLARIDLSRLPASVLQRLADGEHPFSVLAGQDLPSLPPGRDISEK